MDQIYDMLIIGGGPAGYTAALYGARAGLHTLVLEKLSAGGQMALTAQIDNYPGFPQGIDGFLLGQQMQQTAQRFGTETVGAQADLLRLDGAVKTVRTAKDTYFGKTLVLATGANPRELGISKEKELTGHGVHYCAHCDGMFYKGKTVVVAGGGNSAAADALYLSRLCKKVYLVHRRDSLRASYVYHEPLKQAENVEFVWNSTVTGLLGDGKLTGIQITDLESGNIRRLDCDGLFVSIGRTPASALVQGQLVLDDSGYVIADETTRTNLPGVFAAGDVRTKALRQILTAAADGASAAHWAEAFLSQHE